MEPYFDQRDKGFTRVSVLLGAALAIVVVLIFGSPPKTSRPAAADLQLDLPLQEAMQDALSSFIRSKLVNGSVPCADPNEYFQSHLYLRTYTGSIGQVRAAPPPGIAASEWDELFQGTMASHGFAGAALSRCSLAVLGTGGRFHFCLNVERDESAPRGSFLRAPMIFAEVSIQLQDLKSGAPLSCMQYLEPARKSAGATVEYQLFSIHDKGEKLEVTKDRKQFAIRR
jgi:hypothetical protein